MRSFRDGSGRFREAGLDGGCDPISNIATPSATHHTRLAVEAMNLSFRIIGLTVMTAAAGSGETCPQYLVLNAKDLEGLNMNLHGFL
jgi:hypothetical protein